MHHWEWLRKNVLPHEKILDVGIGDAMPWKGYGVNGIHNIKTEVPKYNVVGLDIDGIDNGFPLIRGDACNLPFKDKEFDIVVLSQILEHVTCPDKAIREALRIAKKRVLITIPIGESKDLEERGDWCAQNNPWIKYTDFISDSIIPHHGHIRIFSDLNDLLKFIPSEAKIVDQIREKSDGGEWIGVVLTV